MINEEYKKMNSDIKPSAVLILQTKERMKKEMKKTSKQNTKQRYALVAVCAVLAICVISVPIMTRYGMIPKLPWNTNPNEITEGGQSQGGINSDEQSIPQWYAPGELSVTTIMEQNKMIGNGTGELNVKTSFLSKHEKSIVLPDGIVQIQKVLIAERYVAVIDERKGGEHSSKGDIPNCAGLFYDTETKEFICLSELAEESMKKSRFLSADYAGSINSSDTRLNFEAGNPSNGNCLVSLITANSIKYYICNGSGLAEKATIPTYSTNEFISSKAILSPDGNFAALVIGGDTSGGSVWIADLSGGKIEVKRLDEKNGIKDQAGSNIRFSPDGKYVIYNIYDEENGVWYNELKEKWVAYHIESKTSVTGTGKIIRYIQNGNTVIAQTDLGANVIDLKTGNILSPDILSEWQKKKLTITEIQSEKSGRGFTLTLENMFDKTDKPVVIKEFVNAFAEQDGYIYTYLAGNKTVECYSIADDEKFEVAVSDDFIEANKGSKDVNYSMFIGVDGTKVFLFN